MKQKCYLIILSIFLGLFYLCGCSDSNENNSSDYLLEQDAIAAAEQAEIQQEQAAQDMAEEQFWDEMNAADANGGVHWSDAEDHIGEYVALYGYVAEVSQPGVSGDPIFVDLGDAYPNSRVTGVCWSEYHSQFHDLEDLEGKLIKMEGTLYDYEGTPNIELTDSFQIVVLDN